MPDANRPHRFEIDGRSLSVRLEPAFLAALRDIAKREGTTQAAIMRNLLKRHRRGNLSAALRVYLLRYYQTRAK